MSVTRPASWYEEIELEDEAPEVLPEELPSAVPSPRQARRLDRAALALALLGLALAAAAAIWYVRLRPAAAHVLTVPRVVGLTEARAVRTLTSDGFRVRAVEETSGSGRRVVTSQRPRAATRLRRGAIVTIRVVGRPARSIASR